MANRRGLGVSKKFANGTVHENATGKFMIVDRFSEDDNPEPMLEFEWLSGDKQGKVETNKEVNMNSSIHKFNVLRGLPTAATEPERIEDDISFMSKVDAIYDQVINKSGIIVDLLDRNNNAITGNRDMVGKFFTEIKEMHKTMNKQQETISMLADQINRMMDHGTALASLQEAFIKQQDTMAKLIERMPIAGGKL